MSDARVLRRDFEKRRNAGKRSIIRFNRSLVNWTLRCKCRADNHGAFMDAAPLESKYGEIKWSYLLSGFYLIFPSEFAEARHNAVIAVTDRTVTAELHGLLNAHHLLFR